MPVRIPVILVLLLHAGMLHAGQHSPAGQRPTLVDQAREHGGIESMVMGCGWMNGPPTLESVLKDADVVVHGTVVSVVARLTPDEQRIWTDYTVHPINVVLDRTLGSRTLRSSEPPVFSAEGGTVLVEGLKITQTVSHNGVHVRLAVGDEVVLVGKARDGSYGVSPFGVFVVHSGRVSPNGRWPQLSPDEEPVDLTAFLARVDRIATEGPAASRQRP